MSGLLSVDFQEKGLKEKNNIIRGDFRQLNCPSCKQK